MGTSLVSRVLILGNGVVCLFVLKEQSMEASGCKASAWGAKGEGRLIPGAHLPASPRLLGKFQASEERSCLRKKRGVLEE